MSATWAPRAVHALFGASVLAVILVSAASPGSASASRIDGHATSPAMPNAPLGASLGTAEGTWVDLAMGEFGQLANTFWELFVERAGQTHWTLVTPPGFADNGGLVGVSSGSSFVTGFETSQLISFSPLASSADAGSHWTPGVLNRALTSAPDALAAAPSGGVVALVGNPAEAILSGSGDLSSWQSVISEKSLATSSAAKSCGLSAITAVASSPGGQLLVGASCSKSGRAGIFEQTTGGWRLVGPALPSSAGSSSSKVLRLRSYDGGVDAMIAEEASGHLELLGTRSTDGGGWSSPLEMTVTSGARLISSGVASDGALVVLASANGHLVADELSPAAQHWSALPAPPPGTTAIAFEPDGVLDAMTVDRSRLTVYRRDSSGSKWQRAQVLQVPIEYGSSS